MKFRDRLRGTKYPSSTGWDEWDDVCADAEEKHPIRYWLVGDCWDFITNTCSWPAERFREVKWYLRNRFVSKSHVLQSNHPKGQWQEYSERLLYCNMDSFVIWCETEFVQHYEAWGTKTSGNIEERVLQTVASQLENLDSELWANIYREIREIYTWWKNYQEYEDTTWSEHCSYLDQKYGSVFGRREEQSPEDLQKTSELVESSRIAKENHNKEVEDMLIRLMKIRQGLWL